MSNVPAPPDRLVGARYALGACIGEGGMGAVYKALDLRLDRSVAIKLLHSEHSRRPGADKRFLREAQIGAQLCHENLVQTYDFGRDGDNLYLAMEYLRGRDLGMYLAEQGPLEEVQLLEVAQQVAAGLAAAHNKHLVHRDLKPENIFLITEAPLACKVIDFGMAVQSSHAIGHGIPRLTVDGSIGGTPQYMSPEQLRGKDPIESSDVYALGCVLYELASGSPPYDFDALGEVAAHHLYAPIPDLNDRRPNLSPVFCELVRRCLGKTPSVRPTMEQICGRIERVAASPSAGQLDRHTSRLDRMERSILTRTIPPEESTTLLQDVPIPKGEPGILGIRGTASAELRMALGAAGFSIAEEADASQMQCLLCLGLSDDELREACKSRPLVVADANAGDMERISLLLRMGIAEVVTLPIRPDRLISKLRRAIRIHARSTQEQTS